MHSTTGAQLMIIGEHTSFPIGAMSKRQGSIASSTTEAELVAGHVGTMRLGIPAIKIWSILLGRELKLQLRGDNQAMITTICTGKNQTQRHFERTHRLASGFLHERIKRGDITVEYVKSAEMAADIYTKSFTNASVWEQALRNINIS